MKRTVRALLTSAAIVATLGLPSAAASAHTTTAGAASSAGSAECGQHWNLDELWYNHCGETNVIIYVDRWNVGGVRDFEMCVGPGDHHLGWWPDYLGAWYAGKLC
ncbi:DUF6355 family natural product biosynthesis protein [Nonomuraea sp. NPDC048882]|uniref:DUF6355 family natural product biosynthesis protein n=1 Tax=Nonomuraea sp. NPDC048882 TaxID=3154347 RepID=UPI0033DD243C